MKKVLVIGGTGRIGRFAVEACRRIGDLDVSTGGRAPSGEGGVQIDLGNAATFRALDNFDTIIDCADTSEVSPESCLAYCLEHGQTFLETTALPNVIQSLLRRFRSLDASTSCQGLAVLGMGLFPGVSNVAAQSLSPEGCKRLELAVRLSPFSGSGPGTAKLMTHLLFADVQYYEAGLRVERMPFTIEVDFPFMSGIERGMLIGLPESSMLSISLAVPNIGTYLAPDPRVLSLVLKYIGKVLPKNRKYRHFLSLLVEPCVKLIRTKLLSSRTTPVEISVLRDRLEVEGNRSALTIQFSDGLRATGFAVGAALAELRKRWPPAGVYLPDEVLSLSGLLDEMTRLAGKDLRIIVTPSAH